MKYYQHIVELPLSRFIDCQVDGNLYALVITGEPSLPELQSAWNNILQEFADATGDEEHMAYFTLSKEVSILVITLQQIEKCIEVLQLVRSDFFVNQLNKLLDTNFKFDQSNTESYFAELQRCINRSKGIKMTYDVQSVRLESMRSKHEEGKKPTREYYQSILLTLSDHVQYKIHNDETAYEFCERLRRFNKEMKRLQAANAKGK